MSVSDEKFTAPTGRRSYERNTWIPPAQIALALRMGGRGQLLPRSASYKWRPLGFVRIKEYPLLQRYNNRREEHENFGDNLLAGAVFARGIACRMRRRFCNRYRHGNRSGYGNTGFNLSLIHI